MPEDYYFVHVRMRAPISIGSGSKKKHSGKFAVEDRHFIIKGKPELFKAGKFKDTDVAGVEDSNIMLRKTLRGDGSGKELLPLADALFVPPQQRLKYGTVAGTLKKQYSDRFDEDEIRTWFESENWNLITSQFVKLARKPARI
ncbi:MAG: hypothetical protein GOV15_04665 [Candidatus Diapherotrites archaeon]|nr:hypothetical protein [Candidatus Diapherotrites archaeon]